MNKQEINQILQTAVDRTASDVHFIANKPPIFRIHGILSPSDLPAVNIDGIKNLIASLLTDQQKARFDESKELDFSYAGLDNYQCRFNVYYEKGHMAATVRITPRDINAILKFDLPPVMKKLAQKHSGLVVISGTAGSGKSTTLTYMVDIINNERKGKVITIEDPIEYVHESKKSLIVQREVGADTHTFANALKYALRQDPDVVVIGEMRDYESISMALTTAETGHLVLTTVHAPDAVETLNRIIDAYPIGYRDQICAQLGGNLLGIINQALVPRKDSEERVLATEVLLTTTSIRNLIRRGAFLELRGQLDSEEDPNIHTLEKCLSRLVMDKLISVETARSYAKYPNMLDFSEATDFSKTVVAEEPVEDKEAKPKSERSEKVLIVYHDASEIESMKKILQSNGYPSVEGVDNGDDAREKIAASNPDIIILETRNIYNIESFPFCKGIKDSDKYKAKVIMITADMRLTDPDQAKEAGADAFVVKTKAYELLLKALDNIQ